MKPTQLVLAVLCTPIFALGQETAPADSGQGQTAWNQWRGPDRTGQYQGPAWPSRLTENNLVREWSVPLDKSYSGPVVDGRHVYTTETVDAEREVVRALDRATGEKVWEHSWTGAMKVPFFAARNGSWIRSTPTLDDESLYVAGMRDVLVCLDKSSGEKRWSVDFVERFETPLPDFGFVCSPLVVGDHVYVQAGASVVKLDKRTGETVWRSMNDGGGMMGSAFASPVFATLAGKEQLVVQSRAELAGIDDADGKVLWRVKIRSFRGMNILTPVVWNGGVFTSAYGGRAHYFEVTQEDGEFAVAEKWTNRAQAYMTSPVLVRDHAYLYLRSKRFACVDLAAGEVAWNSSPIGDSYWSLVAQGDRMLALTDAGELHLIAANSKELEIVDTVEVADAETWAHLAVDNGQVFVRELEAMTAFRWSDSANDQPR